MNTMSMTEALHEWPLMVFSMAIMLAAGCSLALLIVRYSSRAHHQGIAHESHEEATRWLRVPLAAIGIIAGAGLMVSTLHLGAPLNAIRTLSNLGQSWLSREILAGLLFMGLWAVTIYAHFHPAASSRLRSGSMVGLVVAGLLLIWTLAGVYMLPARSTWNTWLTPLSFYMTTLLLGVAAVAAFIEYRPPPVPHQTAEGMDTRNTADYRAREGQPAILLSIGLAVIVAQVVVALLHPVSAAITETGAGTILLTVRTLLLLAAALTITWVLTRSAFGYGSAQRRRWALLILAMLLVSESMGRWLFYAAGGGEPF